MTSKIKASFNRVIKILDSFRVDYYKVQVQTDGVNYVFVIETHSGITDKEAKLMFLNFLDENPNYGVNYNKPKPQNALEKALYQTSETIININ